jgi:hypothetical protein
VSVLLIKPTYAAAGQRSARHAPTNLWRKTTRQGRCCRLKRKCWAQMLGTATGVVDTPQRRPPSPFASQMKKNIATELDRRIAAALAATAGSIGPLGRTVNRVNKIHKNLKAQLAAGLLTDAEYAREAGGLLNILCNFDGIITEHHREHERRRIERCRSGWEFKPD